MLRRESRAKSRGSRAKHRRANRARLRAQRRGVLLLVVLSMLVLFMLIGTAFLMTSNQSRSAAKSAAKLNRTGNYATKLLDRALLQVLRDTENPFSAIRYHSLLRDLYGTDGFESVIYSPAPANFDPTFATPASQAARYSGAIGGTLTQQLGPTQGQLIDIYVDVSAKTPPRPHAVKLDRDLYGQTVPHQLPATKGYYNGCLLTVTNGPAAGGTGRILDYEVTSDPVGLPLIARFRVMGFARADGTPLQISPAPRVPEIGDLAGATFIVNGRAYNGTGVGYNPLAPTGAPRLTAMQLMQAAGNVVGAEVALTPNSVYLQLGEIWTLNPGIPDPFMAMLTPAEFQRLNNLAAAGGPVIGYPTFPGPGGDDESYDAADFQNLFLALQSVTPRAQGRVVHATSTTPLAVDHPDVFNDPASFLRLDLEDVPLPSFHRPELVNFWYHRLLMLIASGSTPNDDHVRAIMKPYQDDGTPTSPLSPEQAALITAIKRKISLRPIREDHPNFDGSNSQSRPADLSSYSNLVKNGNIAIPYWEAVGPWDVDNDNDGVPDSIWVDLGDPVTQAEDGTLYKPMYAFLIVDMDSRLNVNAHGLADHIAPPALDPTLSAGVGPGNLAHDVAAAGGLYTSNLLPHGIGYGPAEISLRPLFPQPTNPLHIGNRSEDAFPEIDSYAALLVGRLRTGGDHVTGRYGLAFNQTATNQVTAGVNYQYTPDNPGNPTFDFAQPGLSTLFKFFNYPWRMDQLSAFGVPPDLKSRYSLGLDYAGQPIYEVVNDPNPATLALPQRLPQNLLSGSPYELDLSASHRRDTRQDGLYLQTSFDFGTGQPLTQYVEFGSGGSINSTNTVAGNAADSDDAPFATSDLERVLRAFDADAGALPSRLWDVVDVFDPLKLRAYDPFRVAATATSAFGATSNPEVLAAAQIMAGIARRLVTTDSYSLPVPGGNTTQRLLYGTDSLPGLPRVDDDGNGNVDDGQDYVTVVSDDTFVFDPTMPEPCDDYVAVMRTVRDIIDPEPFSIELPQNPGIVDYLRYRIIVALIREGKIANGMTAGIIENEVGRITNELLAPELIAGQRLDLNRPFGDGVDNPAPGTTITNGVVDDPLEAGDPFLDINGNGKRDDGSLGPEEPFINVDGSVNGSGDPTYTPPSDQLWANLSPPVGNVLAEQVAFDHTNGHAEPLHPDVVAALGTPVFGGVRNLESQSRQLYARHLYCLMLLTMDENYIEPFDQTDPQMLQWIAGVKAARGITDAEAALVVAKKNTYRQIAQWAINCADMRDSDAIMTPFEYDENPWDGWGCPDRTGVNIPLDGDPATNENGDVTMAEANLATQNMAEVINWNAIDPAGGPKVVTTIPGPPASVHQTRGVVWGAERPELLITETLAFHDRRTEDLAHRDTNNPATHDVLNPSSSSRQPDDDLDQSLRPRGSLFVEVYNPGSPDGQRPAELYSRVDSNLDATVPNAWLQSQGVELGRLSNYGAQDNGVGVSDTLTVAASSNNVKRSPVWRIVVVEDLPTARNADTNALLNDDKPRDKIKSGTYPAYSLMEDEVKKWDITKPLPYRAPNPDFDLVFNTDFKPKQKGSNNTFDVSYPYIEREFYFTADNLPATRIDRILQRDFSSPSFRLRIPDRTIKLTPAPTVAVRTQKFIALNNPTLPTTEQRDVPIAPILPGRYGVIGSAGTQYKLSEPALADQLTYTTTMGRRTPTNPATGNSSDTQQVNDLKSAQPSVRRIELRPNPSADVQQLLLANNGGNPSDLMSDDLPKTDPTTFDLHTRAIGRDNELIVDGAVRNITSDNDVDPIAGPAGYYQPCIAIPVDGMNISEPPWGYGPREREAAFNETGSATVRPFNPNAAGGEGRYADSVTSSNNQIYDEPFDKYTPELYRTGTTANYRTIHLQRLANPMLPWNPPAGHTGHDSALPVNPYRTIDSSSVDLTAFNGVGGMRETAYRRPTPSESINLGQRRPWGPSQEFIDYQNNMQRRQVWSYRSLERGSWALLNSNAAQPPDLRTLWAQEPARVDLRPLPKKNEILSLQANRATTMSVKEMPMSLKAPTAQNILDHQVNMVMEHSLGHANDAFGRLFTQAAPEAAPVPTAVGAPTQYSFNNATGNPVNMDSTYPWFTWNNRPFVSAAELMQVPAASSAAMLSHYSTNAPSATPVNPYDGSGVAAGGPPPVPVPAEARLAQSRAPFGHLLNFFSTANFPAAVVPPTAPATIPVGIGAPHFYRFLEYVHVPSRFVGTETVLTPEVFNDVPNAVDPPLTGGDIVGPLDPRYRLQPPFNKVSEQRDPGKVNLNTVIGRRAVDPATGIPKIWSEVYDGIMHRYRDGAPAPNQLSHFGPAWRDVVLSRRGYTQVDATPASVDKPAAIPDTFTFGLNNRFPTFFANPFRSSNAGDLVPLPQMQHYDVDSSWLRSHHYTRGADLQWGVARPVPPAADIQAADDDELRVLGDPLRIVDDVREAGFGDDILVANPVTGQLTDGVAGNTLPLFSEAVSVPSIDTNRNPYMMYQPMTRLGNLVTTRSGVFAIWVTVGYFEVEKAPDWIDPDNAKRRVLRERFGGTLNDSDPATVTARALYDRVYPEGYMLGKEVGSETGNTRRQRGFYIIDRTEAVGFKPGEDLNVEKMIRLRRRIE